jgi:rhodanese-related sulfurtransferase
LDVRDAKEFAEGHLPDAKNIPLAELDKRMASWTSSRAAA